MSFQISILFIFCIVTTTVNGQEVLSKDPLLQFKGFSESGIALGATRVNTNYTQFNTDHGNYSFEKNRYLPAIFDMHFNIGWLLKDKRNAIYTVKTGINFISRSADLKDDAMSNLRYSSNYIQIPVYFGFRDPLKHSTVKNKFFRAIDTNVGLYGAVPMAERLNERNNIDAASRTNIFGNYMRFGVIAEIAISALNEKGNGHKFGIRTSLDFGVLKMKPTQSDLYPHYINVGVFYNITNRYR